MSDTLDLHSKSQRPVPFEGRRLPYAAPALEKGLDIIELLSTEEYGLTRKDIAERLGRTVGEIFRMIDSLLRRGFILQAADTFFLSNRLFQLAHNFPPTKRLLNEAAPRMRELAQRCQQSCHLTVLNGTSQLVIAQVDIPDGVGFSVKLGSKLDTLRSASGRVLLAFRDEAEASHLIAQSRETTNVEELSYTDEALALIRSRGFEDMKSNQFSGVRALSYPIFDTNSHAIAALTVPYLARLDDFERPAASAVQAILADAAAQINLAMGTNSVLSL
ncbi:IclR family transcriptional regulator [Neorhizobium sp. JUb45]|uniref:IclR family transcriptional regulator n=1 Tax=Neorhizobium sp. JUb45 TaxID=2485113 RepID=UPI0010439268|nr:IclR family transcriptional regulator [Neorhizobium sp. JUb45]TCQ97310.1 IclR family transcriptional regulator [Neorhizobium sp. JUb45]